MRARTGSTWSAPVFTAAGVLLLAWFAFGRGHRVPLLGLVDLGVHELGHLLFAAAPGLLPVFAGNGLQTALPLLVAVGFCICLRPLLLAQRGPDPDVTEWPVHGVE